MSWVVALIFVEPFSTMSIGTTSHLCLSSMKLGSQAWFKQFRSNTYFIKLESKASVAYKNGRTIQKYTEDKHQYLLNYEFEFGFGFGFESCPRWKVCQQILLIIINGHDHFDLVRQKNCCEMAKRGI